MDPQTGKLLKRNVDIKNVFFFFFFLFVLKKKKKKKKFFFFFFFPYGITKKIIPNSRDEVNS